MKLQFKINQAASIRRGINAPHSTIEIDVDIATLSQPQREYIATHLKDGHKLWSEYSNPNYPKPLNEPTEKGVLEMLDQQIAIEDQMRAEKEARKKADAEKHAQAVAKVVALIMQEVRKVHVSQRCTELFRTEEDAIIVRSDTRVKFIDAGYDSLPSEIKTLWDAEKERRATMLAERKASEDTKAAAIEKEIEARLDALLNDTQRQMRQRGMLDTQAFREKVMTAERITLRDALRAKLGEAYDLNTLPGGTSGYTYVESITNPKITQKQFRHLVHIEKTLGMEAGELHVHTFDKTSITVFYHTKTPLGQFMTVKISYPASLE